MIFRGHIVHFIEVSSKDYCESEMALLEALERGSIFFPKKFSRLHKLQVVIIICILGINILLLFK